MIRGNVSRIIDSIVFRFAHSPKAFHRYLVQAGSRAVHGQLRGVAGAGGGGGEQDADGRELGRAQACKAPLGGAGTALEDGGVAQATSVWQPAERSDRDCGGAEMRCHQSQMK